MFTFRNVTNVALMAGQALLALTYFYAVMLSFYVFIP